MFFPCSRLSPELEDINENLRLHTLDDNSNDSVSVFCYMPINTYELIVWYCMMATFFHHFTIIAKRKSRHFGPKFPCNFYIYS